MAYMAQKQHSFIRTDSQMPLVWQKSYRK